MNGSRAKQHKDKQAEQPGQMESTNAPGFVGPQVSLLALQRAAGNQAVDTFLGNRQPTHPSLAGWVQTKLKVGSPDDQYEREAEKTAERLTNRNGAEINHQISALGTSGSIQRQAIEDSTDQEINERLGEETDVAEPADEPEELADEEEVGEAEEILQAKAVSSRGLRLGSGLSGAINSLRGRGQALSDSVRGFFEPRFGRDFHRVRVHTGSEAAQLTDEIGARAFTFGENIVFGRSEYEPQGPGGQRLLAHELTHVVQQGKGAHNVIRRAPAPETEYRKKYNRWRAKGGKLSFTDWLKQRLGMRQYGPGATRRHHLVPQEFIKKIKSTGAWKHAAVAKRLKQLHIDIHRLVIDIPEKIHKNIHQGDWNKELEEWFAKNKNFTKKDLQEQINRMLDKHKVPKKYRPPAEKYGRTTRGKDFYKRRRAGKKKYQRREIAKKKAAAKKPGAKAGAFNVGIGISIFSSSAGAGNAGIGISIMSDGASVGTVSAGIAYDSQGVAIGGVGAGVSTGSQSAAAGTAGAGATKDSMAAGAGVAGATTSERVTGAAAGVASKGPVQDVSGAAAGKAQSGDVKGAPNSSGIGATGEVPAGQAAEGKEASSASVGAPGGKAEGSERKITDTSVPAGTRAGSAAGGHGTGKVTGGGAQGDPAKRAESGVPAGAQGGSVPGAQTAGQTTVHGARGDRAQGGSGNVPGDDAQVSAPRTGDPGSAQAGAAGAQGLEVIAAKLGMNMPGTNSKQIEQALVDAARLDRLVRQASPAQLNLLRRLAAGNPDGVYAVPAPNWIDMILTATAGISDADLDYLAKLEWEPTKVKADNLRMAIQKALSRRRTDAESKARLTSDVSPASDPQKPQGDKVKDDKSDDQPHRGKAVKGGQRHKGDKAKGETGGKKGGGDGRGTGLRSKLGKTDFAKIEAIPNLPPDATIIRGFTLISGLYKEVDYQAGDSRNITIRIPYEGRPRQVTIPIVIESRNVSGKHVTLTARIRGSHGGSTIAGWGVVGTDLVLPADAEVTYQW